MAQIIIKAILKDEDYFMGTYYQGAFWICGQFGQGYFKRKLQIDM